MTSPTHLAPSLDTATPVPKPAPKRAKRSARTARCKPRVRQRISAPLDYSSIVVYCVVCFETGFAREATHQTRGGLCGCDQHIRELEMEGRGAIRRRRAASAHH
jgi:hypothetical protein